MKTYLKLFLMAFGIVFLITGTVIFSVPKFRNSLFKTEAPVTKLPEPPVSKDNNLSQENEKASSKHLFEFAEQLKKREKNIKEQEEMINRRLYALKKEEDDLNKLKQDVEKMYTDVAQFIPMITEGEKKNLRKIAKMFETLSPENASPIMAKMPDSTLVIVLSFMKPRSSAKLLSGYAILSTESAKRAAELTEKLKNLVVK